MARQVGQIEVVVLLREDERLLSEDERLLSEHERLLSEDDRLLSEVERLLGEDEHLLSEDEHLLSENTVNRIRMVRLAGKHQRNLNICREPFLFSSRDQ